MSQNYGYIRVSTREQNEDRQLLAMEGCQIPPKNLYMDKQSGKDFNRPSYQRMVRRLKAGDILFVKSIDRLGRNYSEIIEQWSCITKEKGADIIVLDMPLLNTTKSKDLVGTLIADLVLQLLSFVAESERENIRQRQEEGIAAAKRRGIRFGRPEKGSPEDFAAICKRYVQREISAKTAAKLSGFSVSTFYRRVKRYTF